LLPLAPVNPCGLHERCSKSWLSLPAQQRPGFLQKPATASALSAGGKAATAGRETNLQACKPEMLLCVV